MPAQWKLGISAQAKSQIRKLSEDEWNPLVDSLVELLQARNPTTALPDKVKPLKSSQGAWWILKIRQPQVRVIFRLTADGYTIWIGDTIPDSGDKKLEILFAGRRCEDFYEQVQKLYAEYADA